MQVLQNATQWRFDRPSINLIITSILICVIYLLGHFQLAYAVGKYDLAIDDSMPVIYQHTGSYCIETADASLSDAPSAELEIELQGPPVMAYLIWSGRDISNVGDDAILLNDLAIAAEIENHGESGGGSWWHTYISNISALVAEESQPGSPFVFTVSGLTIRENFGGENHGVGMLVVYESPGCEMSEINIHFGLDSFKHTAPAPQYGPNSALHCTSIQPSTQARQVDLQLYVGGINDSGRDATIWLMTSLDTDLPATLIDQPEALSFVDPIGNESSQRQWDRFFASVELPPGHTQACVQIESTGQRGLSAVIVSFTAQVHLDESIMAHTISGKVWMDSNGNGQIEDGEPGIPSTVVLLRDSERTIRQAFVTGSTGDYRFTGMSETTYTVDVVEELSELELVPVSDPDGVLDTETTVFFTTDLVIEDINLGFVPNEIKGSISGLVWRDTNGNGTREDETDGGLAQVSVQLLDAEQNLIQEQTTAEDGVFTFDGLPPASYKLQVNSPLPSGLLQTFETDGTLDGLVDVTIVDGTVHDVQFGYGTLGKIGGRIWNDFNGDGLQSVGETGIDNALLLLTDANGLGRVAATQNGGFYEFLNLEPGGYILRVVIETLPSNAVLTGEKDGILDAITIIEIAISTIITDADFGFEFGLNSLATQPPLIDVSLAGIDLNDEQALINYLLSTLDNQQEPAEQPSQEAPLRESELPVENEGDQSALPDTDSLDADPLDADPLDAESPNAEEPGVPDNNGPTPPTDQQEDDSAPPNVGDDESGETDDNTIDGESSGILTKILFPVIQ